jgi:hypothetical protein
VSEYSLTLPFFVCQEWGNQCVKGCGMGANECASSCRQDNPCGALNPSKPNATSSSSTISSPTGAPTQIFTGLPNNDNPNFGVRVGAEGLIGWVLTVGGLVVGMAVLL